MRKTELLSIVRNLLPTNTMWPNEHDEVRLDGGKTVLMLVTRVADPHLAVKLTDFVYHHTVDFWARDSLRRHVIMDACHHGVHPSVLLRLVKWARKTSLRVIVPMSRHDVDGFDAVELAIQAGHGDLASCLLEQHEPSSHDDLLCQHYPLKVLELAIESGNERCVKDILSNKRVVHHLQPGSVVRQNLNMRWEQRRALVKRLFNIYTCVGAAIRCGMVEIVRAIDKLNPVETHQAVWYAVNKLRSGGSIHVEVSPVIRRIANAYMLEMLWPQIREIIMLRHWELLTEQGHKSSLWDRIRHLWHHRDWDAITSNQWTILPSEVMVRVLSFLLPSEAMEVKKIAFLAEYNID